MLQLNNIHHMSTMKFYTTPRKSIIRNLKDKTVYLLGKCEPHYLECDQICLYLLYNSHESSSLQKPILLKTINNCWCGFTRLPGTSKSSFSCNSWENPFCTCGLSLFCLFWVSPLPIFSRWPRQGMQQNDVYQ